MSACWPLVLPPTAKAVLISLADNANDHGECWPSISTIATRTCLTGRSVQRAIAALEASGHLTADRSNGRHNKYVITPNPRQAVTSDTKSPVTESRGFAAKPTTLCPKPTTQSPPNQKQQKQEQKKKQPQAALPDPPSWVDREAWDGFVAMRVKERHPMTPRAAELILKTLDRFRLAGNDPNAILDQSTRNGWRDVFALKTNGASGHGAHHKPSAVERARAAAIDGELRDRAERYRDEDLVGPDGGVLWPQVAGLLR